MNALLLALAVGSPFMLSAPKAEPPVLRESHQVVPLPRREPALPAGPASGAPTRVRRKDGDGDEECDPCEE